MFYPHCLYYVFVSSRISQITLLVHSPRVYIYIYKNLVYFWGTWSSVLYLSNTFALFLLCVFMLCIHLFLFSILFVHLALD